LLRAVDSESSVSSEGNYVVTGWQNCSENVASEEHINVQLWRPVSIQDTVDEFAGVHSTTIQNGCGCALASPSQLPTFLWRPVDLAGWNVDAERGPVVAGLPADRVCAAAGRGGLRIADSDFHSVAGGRSHCRSPPSPSHHHRHADRVDGSGIHSRGAHTVQSRAGLAHIRS